MTIQLNTNTVQQYQVGHQAASMMILLTWIFHFTRPLYGKTVFYERFYKKQKNTHVILTFSGQESKTVSPTVGVTPSPDITDSLASEILSFKTGTILDELEIRVRNKNMKL